MPQLVTEDGAMDEEAVNREFARAMAAPEPNEETAPAPQRKQATESTAQPVAEPSDDPKHDKARTSSSTGSTGRSGRRGRPRKTEEAKPAPSEGAYVQPVAELLQSLTIVGALAPIPDGPLQTRVRLQAYLVGEHAPGLATAVDSAARHNAVIRKAVESLTMGSAGWVLPAVLAVAPFAAQSLGLWRAPVTEEMAADAKGFEAQVRGAMMAQGQAEQAA